ncbi:MAG: LysM peptidoglycan-binding domain-containing protein [Deltaproteobacteria bacterium]
MARILKQDVCNGWRTAAPYILLAMIGGELFGALPVPMPNAAFGGELQNEQAQQSMDDLAVEISPADAAARIAKERADAQSQRLEALEAEARRKAEQTEQGSAETAPADARKREQAEELAHRKAESDKIISEALENLKKAREEADRAKAAKRKAETQDSERAQMTAKRPSRTKAATGTAVHARCAGGRVVYRKGRRWYVTGADDTLWRIAKRFYGSGSAYPRIYRANRKRLVSPHIVRPCLILRVPGRG